MIYHSIKNTDLKISKIGFGCAPLSSHDYGIVDTQDVFDAVRRSLDLGINMFDTADIYGFGTAEELLSRALKADRHSVVIATKFGLIRDNSGKVIRDCSPGQIRQSLNASLKRLKVDCIPLYQLHWHDGKTPPEVIIETLERCREEGKISFFGCSNLDDSSRRRFLNEAHMVSYQAPYNLLNRGVEDSILTYCSEAEVSFLAHSPLARGFLSGKHIIDKKFDGPDTRNNSLYFSEDHGMEKRRVIDKLMVLSEKYKATSSQISINWLLSNKEVASVLVGIKNTAQLDEALNAVALPLSNDDYTELDSVSTAFKTIKLF